MQTKMQNSNHQGCLVLCGPFNTQPSDWYSFILFKVGEPIVIQSFLVEIAEWW